MKSKSKVLMTCLIVAWLAVGVSACTSAKKICESGDWKKEGQKVGRFGFAKGTWLDMWKKNCGEFNISVNTKDFDRGYKDGLKMYCQPRNFFDSSVSVLSSKLKPELCPRSMKKKLSQAILDGKIVYKLEKQQKELNADIKSVKMEAAVDRDYSQASREMRGVKREARDIQRDIDKIRMKYHSKYL